MQFQFNMGGNNPAMDMVAKMCAEHPKCEGCQLYNENGVNIQGTFTLCENARERIFAGKQGENAC